MMKFLILALLAFSYIRINDASEIEAKIVRGYKARVGQFPFFAFLEILSTKGEYMACGSSLISDEWLITAAHCIVNARLLIAHFGIANLMQLKEKRPPPEHVAIPVLKFSLHPYPGYFSPIAWNDIALIRLSRKVHFSDYIQPVKLPTTCNEPQNIETIAVGNGAISDKTKISPQLNFAILKTETVKVCRNVYPTNFWRKSVICASNQLLNQSICRGDSGGPLIDIFNNTLIGVACFVRLEGCEQGFPQGFTNVYSYLGWIKKVTGIDVPNC